MDSNTKMHKGFMKGKLVMTFYRASKPSTTVQPYTTTTTMKKSQNTSAHLKPAPPPSSLIMNQKKANPQSKHKVSYVIPYTTGTYGMFDNPYGVVADEGVDAKASTYISCVQERFKLEHVNAELVEPTS